MAIKEKEVSFACEVIEADSVTEASSKYETMINKHMQEPRSKYVNGTQLYMRPVSYNLKKLDDTFLAEITFVGTVNKSKPSHKHE